MRLAGADQQLVCRDCEEAFVFSVAEQTFYTERGARQPVRCPDCRARQRAERNADVLKAHDLAGTAGVWQEGYGNYAGFSGSTPSPGAGRPRRAAAADARFAYPAVCAACGHDTEVPFAPRRGRPVFCRDCFNLRRGR